jgi:Nuclease A inhibitor-like protein
MSELREDWEDMEELGVSALDELDSIMLLADGLLMPSESDYPFTAFRWPGPEPLSAPALLAHLELPPETPVEQRDFNAFFERLTAPQDWHSDEDKARLARFAALRDALLAKLSELVVYRVGTIQIHVFIVGRSPSGATMGLRTLLIET